MTDAVAQGTSALPALSTWKECTLDSKVKLQGKSCIYDQLLYYQSERTLGYDVCKSEFNEGVYIFEDTFENWKNTSYASTSMVSAQWNNVINGFTSDACGVGENFGEKKALIFRGETIRSAETKDFDISSGGKLEFELFMPPIGWDVTNQLCRTGFQGKVYVEYSNNTGLNWTTLAEYDPKFYRQSKFFSNSIELPIDAITISTRFRFQQRFFEEARDNWALDNVRILRNLPSNWNKNTNFYNNINIAKKLIQKAQCCLDTDWCEQRYDINEITKCNDFFWYQGEKYLIRLSEIFLCFACLINILKFIYISIQDYYMKSRYPFQDEFNDILSLTIIQKYIKKIPLQYRPSKIIPDEYTTNIHISARMEDNLRNIIADEEGSGDLLIKSDIINKEKKRTQKKIKKEQKKLEERKKGKNFKSSTIEEAIQENKEEDIEINKLQSYKPISEGGFTTTNNNDINTNYAINDTLTSDLDRFQRQNHAMLRVPFEIDESKQFRQVFAITIILIFSILFLFELSYIKPYTIHEPIRPYGVVDGEISFSSYGMILFAAYCDIKEIYYVLKYVIPARDAYLPQVTLDLSDEVRSLIVANNIIPISEIKEYGAFGEGYILFSTIGYSLGVVPWCMFSILLREAVLSYASMRIVTPLLGCIMVLRAILGPAFVLKCYMALSFLFACNFTTREQMGVAFQTIKTQNTALNTSLILGFLALLICSAVAFKWLGIIFAIAIIGGAIYGAFTGCMHNLPLRPWMYITTLRSGIWMKLKKRQRCPCLYWGKYCTEMHNYEEVFVLFVKDEVKFMTLINGGITSSFAK